MRKYENKKKKPAKPTRQRIGDYRIFVGAFPTGALADHIQAIRVKYDPATAQITAPHVTLAGTYWRTGPATAANEAELIEKLSSLSGKISAFDLNLGGVYTFGKRVAYLDVAASEQVEKVRRQLLKLAGKDKHRQFKPHLTLAMRLKQPAFDEMLSELRQTEWHTEQFVVPISELHLMQRGADDPVWQSIFTMPLG